MLTASTNSLHSTFANPAPHPIGTPPVPPPTPGAGSSSGIPVRRSFAEVHVSDGTYEDSEMYTYVYLVEAIHSPQLLVRQAMEQVCGVPPFRRAASSCGVGVMVFATLEVRE